jgi:hypothetical protein
MSTRVATKTGNPQTNPVRERNGNDDLTDYILIPPQTWQDPGYNLFHYAKVGFVLGILGGCTSLVLNVIGSAIWPAISGQAQHPLRLIQVYLTFPFGEAALTLNGGIVLALGCVLYLVTGMFYGVLFTVVISYFVPYASLWARVLVCSILAVWVWAINFYLLLTWLQPLLVGGGWIANLIPWWVAALTHLIFGWTVAVLYPLGSAPWTALRAPIRWR